MVEELQIRCHISVITSPTLMCLAAATEGAQRIFGPSEGVPGHRKILTQGFWSREAAQVQVFVHGVERGGGLLAEENGMAEQTVGG